MNLSGRLWRVGRRRTSEDPLPAIDTATSLALADFRQGDHLPAVTALPVTAHDGKHTSVRASAGAVVISQTCDVVQKNRLTVHLAPLTRLADTPAAEARDGRRPQYVHLPEVGHNAFADLGVIGTVAKARLVGQRRVAGVLQDDDVRRFSLAVARRFGRFAFPDEVVAWLQPLEQVAQSKAKKPTSPEGRAFDDVLELRIECETGWQNYPYALVLAVILKPGVLPTFPDDMLPDLPEDLGRWLRAGDSRLQRTSGQIAERLDKASDPVACYFLWMALGEAWAARCKPRTDGPSAVLNAVTSVRGEVVPADEYSLARVWRSESLDLDHLSAPAPL